MSVLDCTTQHLLCVWDRLYLGVKCLLALRRALPLVALSYRHCCQGLWPTAAGRCATNRTYLCAWSLGQSACCPGLQLRACGQDSLQKPLLLHVHRQMGPLQLLTSWLAYCMLWRSCMGRDD